MDISQLLSNRSGQARVASPSVTHTSNNSETEDTQALSAEVSQLKYSLLNQKNQFYNGELQEIDQKLQVANQQCNNTAQVSALQAERKSIETELAAAAKELADFNKAGATTDRRSATTLEAAIRETEADFAKLNKLKKIDSLDDINNLLSQELAKPETGRWTAPAYYQGGRAVGSTWQPARNLQLVANLSSEKTLQELELKNMVNQCSSEQKLAAAKTGYSSSTDKSRKSADKLVAELQALSSRGTELSIVELAKLQNTLGDALPALKSVVGKKALNGLKQATSSLTPALYEQLNKSLGLQEILEAAGNSRNKSFQRAGAYE